MNHVLTESTQDYLKQVFQLTKNGKPARTNDLAVLLGVSPASVTGKMKNLAASDPPLVEYRKHQGVTLTEEGKQAALKIIRYHRLLETWLVEELGYSWDEVHEDACRLEHVISENFAARIDAVLGYPSRDPHGEFIPSVDLKILDDDSQPLSSLRSSQKTTIIRVNSRNPELLCYLSEIGLIPGTNLEVINHSHFDGNLTIRFDNRELVVGLPITTNIFVEVPYE
jgi:DtxR family Mn-dependent transcriptional regulator